MVSHAGVDGSCHEQKSSVLNIARDSPPAASTVMADGEIFHVHVAAACETTARWSATTTSQERGVVERFSSTTNGISAGPCIARDWLILTQDGCCGILHAHSRSVWTRTMPLPPAALTEGELTLSVTPHLPASGDGLRRVVEFEPHPETPTRMTVSRIAGTGFRNIRTHPHAGRLRAIKSTSGRR
jgi:hypothetical protein